VTAVQDSSPGKIITFYSYKGGTGRSMALANFACWLGKRLKSPSRRVLLMDWDLEAPGLHRYFPDKTELPENETRPGLIHYFEELRVQLAAEPELYNKKLSGGDGAKAMREAFPLDSYLIRDVQPGVDLLKAGNINNEYARLVSTFNWVEFYKNYGKIFRALREWLSSAYAYCLIDSRTGFNDVSGICTMLMPEKLVAVFTPNRQSLSGVVDLAARAVEYRRSADDFRPLAVFPLPSRIERNEEKLRGTWREIYQQAFEAALKNIYQLDSCDLAAYFDDVLLPHVSFYAYGEELALLREKRRDKQSLSRAYEDFFEKLDGLEFAWDKPGEVKTKEETTFLPTVPPAVDFESDIYISYAQLDNERGPSETTAWVEAFQQALELELARLTGSREAVKIWRDMKLIGDDYFDDVISQQISASKIFIPILSPAYLRSKACMRELDEFIRHAEEQSVIFVDGSSRIFPVKTIPLSYSELPQDVIGITSYHFFEAAGEGGLSGFTYSPDSKGFVEQIRLLARDIVKLIKKLKSAEAGDTRADAHNDGLFVFLAETTSDMRQWRERIKDEFQQRGVVVLPDAPLPFTDGMAFNEMVRDHLRRCNLSVHLLGEHYGIVPEEEERSIVELQIELAAERCGDDQEFTQVIWIPENLTVQDERQRTFVDRLKMEVGPKDKYILLQTAPTELNHEILKVIDQRRRSLASPPLTDEPLMVLLDVHRNDLRLVVDLMSLIAERDALPLIITEGESSRENLIRFENSMQETSVLIIVWGSLSAEWMRERLSQALQFAMKNATPLRFCGVYAPADGGSGSHQMFLGEFPTFPTAVPIFVFHTSEQLAKLLDKFI
jgi:cellulose biosynthesis protein BcsQ